MNLNISQYVTKKTALYGGVAILLIVAIGVAAYVQVTQQKKQKSAPAAQTAEKKINDISPTPLPAEALKQTYAEPGMGYAVMYPDSWIVGKTDKGTKSVVITGKQDTPAMGATVVIQNLLTTKTEGVYADAKAASDDLKSQLLTQTKDAKITQEGPIAYTTSDKKEVAGMQWYGEFTLNGTPFKQIQLVLTHPNGMYLHSIAYSAPANVYSANEPTARQIIASFVMSEEAYSATSTKVQAAPSVKP
jgi:hypothetical protein